MSAVQAPDRPRATDELTSVIYSAGADQEKRDGQARRRRIGCRGWHPCRGLAIRRPQEPRAVHLGL